MHAFVVSPVTTPPNGSSQRVPRLMANIGPDENDPAGGDNAQRQAA